jgi:heme/copper-type cytochrome/quinol oxidase subunit 2
MKFISKKKFLFVAALLMSFVLAQTSSACPVCYGSTESNEIQGMNTAITVMLGITGFVLTGISSFFIYMMIRLRRLRNKRVGQAYVNEQGDIQWNNF